MQADDPDLFGNPEVFADFESTADPAVPITQQMIDTAAIPDIVTMAGPRAQNDTLSTDNSVAADDNTFGPTTDGNPVDQRANKNLAGQMAVVYTVVHTASEPVAMRGGRPEVTTRTADFALSTTANIWLCMMLMMAYYFI